MADRPASPYAAYDVLAKWDSPSFDAATRAVLDRRLHHPPERRFFDPDEFALLEAVCARLIPQTEPPVPIVPFIDEAVFENRGEGFRGPGQPSLHETWRRLVAGIDALAREIHGRAFIGLDPAEQDGLLTSLQSGRADSRLFGGLSPKTLFTDVLLKTAAGVYYSHPQAWSEIGYGGPAAPRGYVRMGLNERDPWEANLAPAPGDGL